MLLQSLEPCTGSIWDMGRNICPNWCLSWVCHAYVLRRLQTLISRGRWTPTEGRNTMQPKTACTELCASRCFAWRLRTADTSQERHLADDAPLSNQFCSLCFHHALDLPPQFYMQSPKLRTLHPKDLSESHAFLRAGHFIRLQPPPSQNTSSRNP